MLSIIKQTVAGLLTLISGLTTVNSPIPAEPVNSSVNEPVQTEVVDYSLSAETPNSSEFVAETAKLGGDTATETPKEVKKEISCVDWARANSYLSPPRVRFARELKITRLTASNGAWIIFGGKSVFGAAGHAGIVRFVNPDQPRILTWEGHNYPKGQHRIMTININDPKYDVLGFFDGSK